MFGLDGWQIIVALSIVFVGALVQGSIGTGLGLLAVPVLVMIDPAFIPGAISLAVVPLSSGMAIREWGSIDRIGVTRALIGRIPGTFAGAWVAANAGESTIAVIVGACVLLAIIASLTGFRFEPSRRNVVIAGIASGFTGTATGVGGPPMAITYQHSNPDVVRSSLALFFLVGGLFSVAVLIGNGVIGVRQVELALLLLPGVVGGLATSRLTVRAMPPDKMRPLVLLACGLSAVALLVKPLG